MKNKKIVFLSLGLLLIVTTLVISISAWLTDTADTGETTFTVGDVSYTLNGGFIPSQIVVPGQELLNDPLTLTNASTVSSELRIKVEYTFKKESESTSGTWEDVVVTDGLSDLLLTSDAPAGGFSLSSDWEENLNGQPEGFWYYSPTGGTVVTAGTQTIPILADLMLDGNKVGNNYSKHQLNILITIQAKQSEYVNWSTLGSINFSTGLA